MAADKPDSDERTEPASDKKRQESRSKGSVSKSMDLNSAVMLLFGFLALYTLGAKMVSQMSAMFKQVLGHLSSIEVTITSITELIYTVFAFLAVSLLPVMGTMMFIGIISNFVQVGFMFSPKALELKWEKLNPLTGIKRVMFSMHSAVEIGKGLLKITVVGFITYLIVDNVIIDSISLVDSDVMSIAQFMISAMAEIVIKVGFIFFALAGFDYMYQRFEFEKNLRMTKQEVKDEYKMSEGDPQIKGRIKTIQRQIAYKRMMTDVPKADVVVTNPTHFAVALKYDTKKMSAPNVVAKGADLIALKIKEIAKANGVPIVEDKPLAQALFKSVKIGDQIPEKLFQAVAQILAYIYKLKQAR
jgi:flagellar biosynthetic protein FlhB